MLINLKLTEIKKLSAAYISCLASVSAVFDFCKLQTADHRSQTACKLHWMFSDCYRKYLCHFSRHCLEVS